MAAFEHDHDLVARLVDRDEAAFGEFLELQAPRLYSFALSRLGRDADAAQEVVQTTLLKVIPKLGTYRGEASLFSWLCTFCRHEIHRYLESADRAVGREVALRRADRMSNLLDLIGSEAAVDPERHLLGRELAVLVKTTLDQLPDRYAVILEWKYLEGMSVKDIAGRLETSPTAVQSSLARARQAFRDDFGPLAPILSVLEPPQRR